MNRKGRVVKEFLLVLVTIVFTSAIVFTLVSLGVVEVEASSDTTSMLNTEFLPFGRGGELVINNFRFCDYESSLSGCWQETEYFYSGDEVHFSFEVISSTYMGDLILVENYQLLGPYGEIILSVEAEDNFYYEIQSKNEKETVYFTDYFILGSDAVPGTYTVNLIINNQLLEKQVVLTENFQVLQE